jgi:chromosome segregation protein
VYLKSLVIKGFKSFADRSVMDFEPGISVIVGPNGSGKSNVSEAVQWVLGEKKPSNLRVQALEELIFSGSSARQAVGVAEVDLILDNSDNTLPIEFGQVSLTRRMYRSGESEYFINGSPCRRMDIIDILYDSGIGQGAHSIISQGNLTGVLESSPEERCALIEEAAGILKHKKRKEKANRKLGAMDASLDRVRDIIQIIESQLRPLERQAARAQKYETLDAELRALDLSLAVEELHSLQVAWSQQDHHEKEIDAEAELAHFRLNEKEADLNKRQLALEEKGLFAGDLNEQRIRCQSILQRLDAGMLVLEEKGKNLVSRLSDLRATIYNSEARLKHAQEEHLQLDEKISESDALLQAYYTEFNELSHESEAVIRVKKAAEETYNQLNQSLRNHETALETSRANLTKTQDSLASLNLEEGLLKERSDQMEQEFLATQGILAERRLKMDKLEQDLARAKKESDLAKSDIDKRVRILDTKKQKLDAQRDLLSSIRGEIKALEEIDRAFESASPALSWILAHQDQFKGVVGPLSHVVKVAEKTELPLGCDTPTLERLVERLLGADLFGLVVQDAESANLIAERLVAQGDSKGEISLIPLGGLRALDKEPANGARLIECLEYPSEYRPAVEALLGDIYLAQSIVEARKFHLRDKAGVRFATPEGAVVWPNGKLTLGVQVNDIDGVLTRKRRLDSLADELEKATAQLTDIELDISMADQNLSVAQQDDFELAQLLAKLQGDSDSAREEVVRLEESMTQMLYRREEVDFKLKDVERRRQATAPLADEFALRIEQLEGEIATLKEEVDTASHELTVSTESRNAISDKISECKIKLETSKGSASFNKGRFNTLTVEIDNLTQMLAVSRTTESSLDIIRLRVEPLYALYEELHAGAAVWAEKLRDQALLEQTDSTNLRKVIQEANKAVEEAHGALQAINERLTQVRVEKAKLETEVEHAIRRIVEDNQTTLEVALETPLPEDRHATEEQANRLRKKIANLGAVNHVAMEEFNALKKRRDYMLSQIEDLQEARKALAKISKALDNKMHNQFHETFTQVNLNFQQILGILFPGGSGQLLLTESDTNELNGVEVSVQPRGKRITKLSLMSGGEKSLAALALLFAVYSIRKVPFYILDEVEAALDDTNLVRLLDYLEQMRSHTQLILVTHQRRTMERADVLYGVTMQAAGVSKLLSQRLDQALRHAAPPDPDPL